MNLHRFETHCGHVFLLLNKSCHFISFKTYEKPSIFRSRPSQKGNGSTPDLTSQTCNCKHACKVDCDVKSGINLLPFWHVGEQKMLGMYWLCSWIDIALKKANSWSALQIRVTSFRASSFKKWWTWSNLFKSMKKKVSYQGHFIACNCSAIIVSTLKR